MDSLWLVYEDIKTMRLAREMLILYKKENHLMQVCGCCLYSAQLMAANVE